MNQQDLNALTEFWHRETNRLNDSIDSAFKSAQDDSYARGYRRGREDLIDIRKQRDELLELLERASVSLGAFTSDEGWAQADMDTMDSIDAAIARVKGQQ